MTEFFLEIPFNPSDINKIEQLTRRRDVIRSVYSNDLFDQYSLASYFKEIHIHKSQFCAMFDRNIFTAIIEVAKKSGEKSLTLTQKTACALLAFFQISDVKIEPNMAIYEYIDSGHYEEAINQLSLFRAVDNLDPQALIDLALGRKNKIPSGMLDIQRVEPIADKKGEHLHQWKIFYGCILKLACIETKGGKSVEKFKCFLEWMHNEYIFKAIAVTFGLIFFSNKRFPSMIKNLNSQEKEKILRGLRNATWDMTVAHFWAKNALEKKEEGLLWLLCTEDKALKTIVNYIVSSYKLPEELEQKCKASFREYLGDKEWERIYDIYVNLEKNINDSSRKMNNIESTKALYPDIDKLEEELLSKLISKK